MDELEKNILRRRRADLIENVHLTRELAVEMKEAGLLTQEGVTAIESEKDNGVRVTRMVDCILSLSPANGFSQFCRVIGDPIASPECRELISEMEMELGLEKGDIQPLKEMVNEASVLVHRKFGLSKRFSESDKKEVTELIAVKLQLAHDDWRREADKVKRELDRVTSEIKAKDGRALRLAATLRDFVRKHEKQLVTHSHDRITTTELVRKMMQPPSEESVLKDFQENLEGFFHQVEMILNHRDALFYEKEKCLRLLRVKDDRVQLDEVIGRLTGMSINPDGSVERKDVIIGRLKNQVEELEKEAAEYEITMANYKKQMAEKEREIADLRHRIHID